MNQSFRTEFISAEMTRAVRYRVLWPHKSREADCVIDIDDDTGARHIGAFDENQKLVGVCSLFDQRSERNKEALPLLDSVYRLRVMGTMPEVRGAGAGAAIIEFACAWCKGQGVKWLWCDAREIAFPFYSKMEFDFVSKSYEVPEIGLHRMMARKL